MTTHADINESEASLADMRRYIDRVISSKITHKSIITKHQTAISGHRESIVRHQTNINQHQVGMAHEEAKLQKINCELGERLIRSKLPVIMDMYLRPVKGVNPKIKAHCNTKLFPGRICYEASCEPGRPLSGEALCVVDALCEFGFPRKALEAKLVDGMTDRAVIGISLLKQQVLDTVINAIVANRLPHVTDTPEQVRANVIRDITCAPPKEHAASHVSNGNGVTPRSLRPLPPGRNGNGADGQHTDTYVGR